MVCTIISELETPVSYIQYLLRDDLEFNAVSSAVPQGTMTFNGMSTSCPPRGNFTGCQCDSVLNVATCEVPRTHTSLGNQSVTVAGPHLRNNLPLRLCDSELTF